MLSSPANSITTRSRPTPNPACGGAPYLGHQTMNPSGLRLAIKACEQCRATAWLAHRTSSITN